MLKKNVCGYVFGPEEKGPCPNGHQGKHTIKNE